MRGPDQDAASTAKGQDGSRRERLRAALRENLRRRKGQAAPRSNPSPADEGEQPAGEAGEDKARR